MAKTIEVEIDKPLGLTIGQKNVDGIKAVVVTVGLYIHAERERESSAMMPTSVVESRLDNKKKV